MADGDNTVYTKEYFLESTEPYEELYKIESSFERERQLAKMADLARACGVRNFRTLFKDYCKSIAEAANKTYAANVSNFTGQEFELNTGTWRADDLGISRFGIRGYEEIACVHPIMPSERLVDIDTGFEKIKISYSKGGIWGNAIFNRSKIANSRSIIDLADYGMAVTSENARYLVQYLSDVENLNFDVIPVHNSVSRLGWVGEGKFSPYVENLIYDGDESFRPVYDAVSCSGRSSDWFDFVAKIREENNTLTKIVFAASFASVLVGPCNCLPFFVHLWGGSGNGKTVALMLAASVWANPKVGEYIHTFNSTDVGQELSAGFLNSLPLILDEMQIQKTDRKDFDSMIYKLSEGVGRRRGAKSGGLQRTQTWRNCILTNGEAPITSSHSGAGAINRIIEINTEGIHFFKNAKKTADFLVNNYGHAGKTFVEKLVDPEVMKLARKMQNDFFEKLSDKDITEKQTITASLILTADALIDMFIFRDGKGLAVDEITQFLATHSEVSADLRAYEWLLDWIAQNGQKFSTASGSPEIWGKKDFDKISIIRSVFNKACAENGFNSTSFLSWMKRNGMIETEGKAYTKRIRVNDMKCQCVILKTNVIPEFGFTELPEGFHEVMDDEQMEF